MLRRLPLFVKIMLKNNFCGNAAALAWLQTVVVTAPSGAYLFIGPASIGKRFAAELTSAVLLKTERPALESHPDFIRVERLYDEKREVKKQDISLDQIRDLKERVSGTAWKKDGAKVVIIDEAERLTVEAQNTLLKLIEEPPRQTTFFLIAEHQDALLPTVISRVQQVRFHRVADDEIREHLSARQNPTDYIDEAVRAAAGRPGVAFRYAEDEDFRVHARQINSFVQGICASSYYDMSRAFEGLLPHGPESSLDERQELIVELLYRTQAEFHERSRTTAATADIERLASFLAALIKARRLGAAYVRPALVADTLFFSVVTP